MRARLALVASGTDYELREVKLSAKPAAMVEASSKATVPVLVLPDGQVIDESLEIMRWSLSHNDPDGWLMRDAPDLIAANDGPFKQDLDRYKYHDRYASDAATHRHNGLKFLIELNARLADKGQLCGKEPGIADMAIMPFVRQFAATDKTWFDAQPLPHLQTWLEGHLASGLFAAIMTKLPFWQDDAAPSLERRLPV